MGETSFIDVAATPGTSLIAGQALNLYAEDSAVVGSSTVNVLTYTVTVGSIFKIQGFSGTGGPAARYTLKIDSSKRSSLKTSAAKPSNFVNFGNGFIVATGGEIVTVSVFHSEQTAHEFAINLWGSLV